MRVIVRKERGENGAWIWALPEHLGDNVISLPVRGDPPDLRSDDDPEASDDDRAE